MKSKDYIKEMSNIKPSEDLINRTITNIKHVQNAEKINKGFGIKKILAGIAATLALTAGTVGAYVAITGNTEILEKIGIHLSQNYENNVENIEEGNGVIYTINYKGIEAKLVSASIDNINLVLELNLKLDEKYENVSNPDLKVGNIQIIKPSTNTWLGDDLIFSQTQSISKREDGTYKLFKYISIKDPNLNLSAFWDEMFADDDELDCLVFFSGLYDENDKLIKKIPEAYNLDFRLSKPNNFKSIDDVIYVNETIEYKNIEATINTIQPSAFGNIISIYVYENNIDIDKINDIQKIDFNIKDKDGNKIKIISRTENITLGDYQEDGKYHQLGLEVQLTVDDIENKEYDIKMIESDKVLITKEQVKSIYDKLIEDINPQTDEIDEDYSFNNEEDFDNQDDYTVQVFRFDAEKSDAQDCEPYILLWNNVLMFAEGENVEAESTVAFARYKINSDNTITFSNITTQDFAFFNEADAYIDTVEGEKYIVFADGYSVVTYKFEKSYEMR